MPHLGPILRLLRQEAGQCVRRRLLQHWNGCQLVDRCRLLDLPLLISNTNFNSLFPLYLLFYPVRNVFKIEINKEDKFHNKQLIFYFLGHHDCDDRPVPRWIDVRQSRMRRRSTSKRLGRFPAGRQTMDSASAQTTVSWYVWNPILFTKMCLKQSAKKMPIILTHYYIQIFRSRPTLVRRHVPERIDWPLPSQRHRLQHHADASRLWRHRIASLA